MKINSALMFATFPLVLSCASANKESIIRTPSSKFIELPIDQSKVITQKAAMDCGPAAIFNTFSVGNKTMQEKIDRLDGATNDDKYNSFLNQIALSPSEQLGPDYSRTNDRGTWMGDMRFMIQDLLGSPQGIVGKYFNRPDMVYGPGEFVEKIRKDFEGSLKAGVPIIIAVGAYRENKRLTAHYLTVTGVSSHLEKGKFELTFINPASSMPRVGVATISDSLDPYWGHTWDIYIKPGPVVGGRIVTEDGGIESPFLIFESKGFYIGKSQEDKFVLEHGFGFFEGDSY